MTNREKIIVGVMVLTVGYGAIELLLPSVLDAVRPTQTIIDFGSTKFQLAEDVRNHPRRDRYVAAHPMAGTENAGPDAALTGLFKGKTDVHCDLESSAPDACNCCWKLSGSMSRSLAPGGALAAVIVSSLSSGVGAPSA